MNLKIKKEDTQWLVEKARTYLGTPFLHRGRCKKNGVDCGGLIICCLKDLGYEPPDMTVYGREPHKDGLRQYLIRSIGVPLNDKNEMKPGDIALMKFVKEPQHVAIIGNYVLDKTGKNLSLIHSYGTVEKVVEHRLDDDWKDKIIEIYRFETLT